MICSLDVDEMKFRQSSFQTVSYHIIKDFSAFLLVLEIGNVPDGGPSLECVKCLWVKTNHHTGPNVSRKSHFIKASQVISVRLYFDTTAYNQSLPR